MKPLSHTFTVIPRRRLYHNFQGNPRRGSALLLTLLVVSLMLVVVLAFVTFVRLELRKQVNEQRLAEARAQAKLGMNLAIARLQDLAGPDQRVTARSDLFTSTGNNVYKGGLHVATQKSKWVGVWDSSSFQETEPEMKKFLGWLVSGSPSEQDQINTIQTAYPSPENLITLVGDNTVTSSDDKVLAQKVQAGSSGSYAWWVKDENLAARFNTFDPFRNSGDPVKRQFSLHSAQRFGMELMNYNPANELGELLYPHANATFTNLVQRVTSMEQVPLIWHNNPSHQDNYRELIRNRYHDLSLVSRGVLTDVQNGGLRTDLSLAFEMPYDEWVDSEFVDANPNAEVPRYQPVGYPRNRKLASLIRIDDFSPYGFTPEGSKAPQQSTPVPYDFPAPEDLKTDKSSNIDPVLRGPSWDLFRNYYRLYKSDDPDLEEYGFDSDMNLQSDGSMIGRSAFPRGLGFDFARRYGEDPLVWDYAEDFGPSGESFTMALPLGRAALPGVNPVVIRLQNVLSYRTRKVAGANPGDPSQYELDMYIDPIITLWNPYNVKLKTGDSNGQPLVLAINYLNMRAIVVATVPPGIFKVFNTNFDSLLDKYGDNSSNFDTNLDQVYEVELKLGNRVMEPGEVLVFSHRGPAKPYWRNESPNRDNPKSPLSGIEITLEPGLDHLTGDSGMVFENVLPNMGSGIPGGRMGAGTELKFLMSMEGKFEVTGLSKGTKGPFMSSFQAGLINSIKNFSSGVKVDDMVDNKWPTAFYDVYMKNADSTGPINMVAQYNPRAQSFQQGKGYFKIHAAAYMNNNEEDMFGGESLAPANFSLNNIIAAAGDNGFWGPKNTTAGFGDWNTHVPMFNIPRAPLTSLGNLQHVPVSVMVDEPSNVVGNSLASIFVGYTSLSQQTLNNTGGLNGAGRSPGRDDWTMTRVDWSYLLNQVLFDKYYFSGIAPGNGYSSARDLLEDHIQNGAPLPNSTYRFHSAEGEYPSDILDRLYDSNGAPGIDSPREISSHLMVDGMFNINSTSEEAWKSLLASTRMLKVETENNNEVNSTGSVYTRMSIPANGENEEWTGFRSLTDEQVERLAQEIVKQVRERGPFLNIADFVNRRLADKPDPSSVDEHMKCGPLQAAIDAAGLNDNYFQPTLDDKGLNKSDLEPWVRDRVDENSKVGQGLNGYVTQADLLSVISPLLSARSDTFTIRAYGDVEDGNGNVQARAWCEAVVQRIPGYQDSTKASNEPASWAPHEQPSPAGSYDTSTARRKFEIVRFRWLTPEEI